MNFHWELGKVHGKSISKPRNSRFSPVSWVYTTILEGSRHSRFPFLSCEIGCGAEQWQRVWRTILAVERTGSLHETHPLPLPANDAFTFIGRRQCLGVPGVAIVFEGRLAMAQRGR
jgi:hypothetical protein